MSKMLEEIREQPDALERTLDSELPGIEALRARLSESRPRLIVLAARGTSDNAATFGRYCSKSPPASRCRLPRPPLSPLRRADSLQGRLGGRDLAIRGIHRHDAFLQRAREDGVVTVGMTNEAAVRWRASPNTPFLVRAGKEKSVAATKTYTGQLLAMYLLAYALGAEIDLEN